MATDGYTPGSGDTVAADSVGGQGFQYVKVAVGGDNVAVPVEASAPLPTADAAVLAELALLLTELGQKVEPADLAALASAAKQDTLKTSVDAITAKLTTDPATATAQATQATKLDTLHTDNGGPGSAPPALTGSGSGIIGYLRNVLDALRGTLTVGGTVAVSAVPAATVAASPPLNIRKTVTTAGTAVALNGSALVVRRALVTALSTNTGVVVPGGSGVVAASGTRNGPGLNAGDAVQLESVDLNAVFIDSTVNGEGVSVLYQV